MKVLQKGSSGVRITSFCNLQVPASGFCSSLILGEPKLMVDDTSTLHHSSTLPRGLSSPHDFRRIYLWGLGA